MRCSVGINSFYYGPRPLHGFVLPFPVRRLRGNSAFERGDIPTAMGAYEAQLQVLEGLKG